MASLARVLALAVAYGCALSAPARAADAQANAADAQASAAVGQPSASAPPPAATEPTRAECLAAHERAQDSRLDGRLLNARAELRLCSAATCPSLVSRDCVTWLGEIETQLPSVIFRAVKDGEDVIALRVREGEEVLTDSLTGSPLELDPGPHRFVAELPGFAPQEATYVLSAGDKGRVVRFDFVSPRVLPRPSVPPPRPQPSPMMARPVRGVTYALGGGTLAAALAGAILGGLALSERSSAQARCAPLCTDNDVKSVRRLALASDLAFGMALLGTGVTIYSYATRPEVPANPPGSSGPLRVVLLGTAIAAVGHF